MGAAAALAGVPGAGRIDEDAPHDDGGDGIEVVAAVEFLVLLGQAQVGFVHERRRLQRGVRIGAVGGVGAPAQLLVDEWKEDFQALIVAGGPGVEQAGNFV